MRCTAHQKVGFEALRFSAESINDWWSEMLRAERALGLILKQVRDRADRVR